MSAVQVMVIEDNEAIALDLGNDLKSIGYEVPAVISTPSEAIEVAKIHSPDVVLMNIKHGSTNGQVENIQKICAKMDVPIICYATSGDRASQRARMANLCKCQLTSLDKGSLMTSIDSAYRWHILRKDINENIGLMLNLAPISIYFEDAYGCCIFCNDEFARLMGTTSDEVSGKFMDKIYASDAFEMPECAYIGKGSAKEFQLNFKNLSGRQVQATLRKSPIYGQDGQIQGQVCSIYKVSNLAGFEDSLRKRECQFSSFFNSSPYGFALTDDKGTIIEWNQMMERSTGLEISEVIGRPIWDVYSMIVFQGDDLDDLLSKRSEIREFFDKGRDSQPDKPFEISIEDESGHRRVLQVAIFPIRTMIGAMLGIISRDITSLITSLGMVGQRLSITADNLGEISSKKELELLKISPHVEVGPLSENELEECQFLEELGPKAKLPEDLFQRSISILAKSKNQLTSDFIKAPAGGSLDKRIIEMLEDRHNRTRSVALVYDILSRSIDPEKISLKKYISNLINAIAKSQGIKPSEISFRLKIDDAMLRLESAMPCGLIINELISQFIKHVFPDGQGEICIEFRSLGASIYKLIVSDNGAKCGEESSAENAIVPLLQILSPLLREIDGYIRVDETDGNRVEICFNELKYDRRLKMAQDGVQKGIPK